MLKKGFWGVFFSQFSNNLNSWSCD